MPKDEKLDISNIDINQVARVVSKAALSQYGIVCLTYKPSIFSSGTKEEIKRLPNEEASQGVIVKTDSTNHFVITLFVIVASGVKISEVLNSCQEVIRHQIRQTFGVHAREVNIYAVGVE
ncbi:MAG: Asp23/Gls24 family envelope stress response protein [Coprobacillus sp.]|nr:Asp23/Gls24 family envelope stress response protein [Coprobacillus sp.]